MSAHHEGTGRPAGRRGLGVFFAILLILAAGGAAVWIITKYGPILGAN
jgi:hypothetical protein